jgi:protein-L-isoaspartate(D-aspartate) O-methyltransferase
MELVRLERTIPMDMDSSGKATARGTAAGVLFWVGISMMQVDVTLGNKGEEPFEKKQDAAFTQRVSERHRMVSVQIEARGVRDPNVLRALKRVPRHALVPAHLQAHAYDDNPLPIGHQQTISQPYIVAFMTEVLALDPNDRVLEIGTGSGYQAAVCAEIAREVFTIEIVDALAKTARLRLQKLGYRNITVKSGDGFFGWPEQAPYDAIIGTAAAGRIPPPLLEQLKPGGRMILPVENENGFQYLVLITKDADGRIERKRVLPVRFVPMTGKVSD